MDMPVRRSEPVGWPFPWWGLLGGGVFLGAMFTPLSPWVGIVAAFGFAMLAIPFLAISALIGGDTAGPMGALIGLSFLFFLGVGKVVVDIARAPDRRTRSRLMNRLALFILLTTGLVLSAVQLEAAWRY
jgi:hypothetical protein